MINNRIHAMKSARYVLLWIAPLFAATISDLRAQIPTGALFRFRADTAITRQGDTVMRWGDISGHGYDAVAPSAALAPRLLDRAAGGRPAVMFQGGGQHLRCPDRFPVNHDYTKVVVARIADYGATNNILSGASVHAFWLGGTHALKLFHSGNVADAYIETRNGPNLLFGQFEHGLMRGSLWVNGSFAGRGNTTTANTDSALMIGAFAGGYVMNGDISEIIVYDRILTGAERADLEAYLASRYGIAIERPNSSRGITFTAFPRAYAFYPRGIDDTAHVQIAGTVTAPGFDSVRLDVYRDGGYWKSTSQPLAYGATGAAFAFSPGIYARPVEFGVRVLLVRNGADSLVAARDSIICGDVILITGQSNSTPGDAGVTITNQFCRTFGVNTGYGTYDDSDTLFGRSTANSGGFQGRWHVGVWGLGLQLQILEKHGVPTCAITGGVGGSSIEINQRNDANPTDPTTIYGRTLFRMRAAGLAANARYLFWYQGESNGIENYYDNFKALHADWRTDYPALQRMYVVQIRPGCAQNPTHGQLRELLRTLPDSLPLVHAYAPTAVPGHDGCHYLASGYAVMSTQLYRLVARDFYGSDDTVEIESPNIERAYFASAAHDEIVLRFQPDQRMVWPADSVIGDVLRKMNEQFFLDGVSGAVVSGRAVGNTIRLRLAAPSNARRITYVPAIAYEGTNYIYEGPWLANTRGVGAFTFNDVPLYASASGIQAAAMPGPAAVAIKALTPSPARQTATLHLAMPRPAAADVEIVDITGRVVLSMTTSTLPAGEPTVTLNVAELPTGAYRVVVYADHNRSQAPLLIVR